MLFLLKFILITFGIVITIARAKPLAPIREFLTKKSITLGIFLSCFQCLGFWIAPIAYCIALYCPEVVGYIFIATGTCFLFDKLIK